MWNCSSENIRKSINKMENCRLDSQQRGAYSFTYAEKSDIGRNSTALL